MLQEPPADHPRARANLHQAVSGPDARHTEHRRGDVPAVRLREAGPAIEPLRLAVERRRRAGLRQRRAGAGA